MIEPINRDEARKFLNCLGTNGGWHNLQTFADRDDYAAWCGILDGDTDEELMFDSLDEYAVRGHGIFVAVNRFDGKRQKPFLSQIRSLHVDIDKTRKQPRWHLRPSIIVDSGHGFHAYWLVSGAVTADRAEAVNKKLAEYYGGDLGAYDCTRVLRLPGTFNQKSQPVRCRLLDASGMSYSVDQIEWDISIDRSLEQIFEPLRCAGEGERNTLCNALTFRAAKAGYRELDIRRAASAAAEASGLSKAEVKTLLRGNGAIAAGKAKAKQAAAKPSPKELYDIFCEKYHCFSIQGDIYIYVGGVYKADNSCNIITRFAMDRLGTLYRHRDREELRQYITEASAITDRAEQELIRAGGGKYLNCANCLLNIENLEVVQHTPSNKSILQIPTPWRPDTASGDIDALLETILPGQNADRAALLEFFGAVLLPHCVFQRYPILVGEGSNGKSTILDVFSSVIGRHNRSTVSLQALCNERFQISQLLGKMANIFSDLPTTKLVDSSALKTIVAGDEITVDRKFRDPISAKVFAKLLFSCNKLPDSIDQSNGFYRRLHIINFNQVFGKNGTNYNEFVAKYTTEENRSRMLALCVEGARRLLTCGFTFSRESEEALVEQMRTQSTAIAFALDCVIPEVGGKILSKIVYDRYKKYCEEQGMKADKAQREVTKAVCRMVRGATTYDGHGSFIKNVRLISDDPTF